MEKYVDNDVFTFNCSLKSELTDEDITLYTKPFPDTPLPCSDEEAWKIYDAQEDLVQSRYFTKERIDELKRKFIQRIQECENPFYIACVDRDGGYNVTEDMLFDVEK